MFSTFRSSRLLLSKTRLSRPSLFGACRGFSQSSEEKLDELIDTDKLKDQSVTCLMLHPVSYPNHGPVVELSLASEALGLVRSLDWEIAPGPVEKEQLDQEDEDDLSSQEEGLEEDDLG